MNSDSLDSSKILQGWYHYHPHQWYISRAASVPLHPCSENFNSPFNHRNTQRSKFLSLLGKWGMKGSGTCGENAPPRSLLQGRVCSSSCEQLRGCLQLQRATLPQGTSFQGCPCQVINHKKGAKAWLWQTQMPQSCPGDWPSPCEAWIAVWALPFLLQSRFLPLPFICADP